MNKKLIATILLCTGIAGAQTTTHCTTMPNGLGGTSTRCESDTAPAGPNLHDRIEEEQRRNAQAFGNAAGSLAGALIMRHKINSIKKEQCHANGAGSTWTVHYLPTGQVVAGGVCSAKDAK